MTNPAQQFTQNAPYSQEAEEALLGALLLNPQSFLNIASFLNVEDFFLVRHAQIWRALERLHERGERMDYITVSDELRAIGVFDEIGGQAYLTQLVNNTPSSVHAEVYGRLVERASVRRRLLVASDEIRRLAMDEELQLDKVISEAESTLFSVSDTQLKREFVPLWQAVSEYYDQMEYLLQNDGGSVGIPTGFRALDGLLGGFQKSDLIVFAGRPGMGKTSFLLTVALNVARIGGRVALFTMEMGVEQMVQRLISMETGINMQKLRLAQLTPRENARFTEAVGRISNLPIFIDDTPALTPIEMRTKCRRLRHEAGLDLIIVDYMQLMSAGKLHENNRVQEISYISRSLKELAREMNVTLLSAAQLSRAVEQRQDKRPVLSDLRESGCLAGDTQVYLPDIGHSVPIENLVGKKDFRVLSLNTDTWKLEYGTVTNAFCTGTKPVYRLTTALGRTIRVTANHKFLTIDGWKRLDALQIGSHIALPRTTTTSSQQFISDEELALPGHLIGDGCTLPSHAIQYTTIELDLAETSELAVIIQYFEDRVANTNRDIIPHQVWRKFAVPAMGEIGLTTRQMQAGIGISYCGTGLYKQNVSRERATRLAEVVQSSELMKLAESDVYWDKIASIEPDGETAVYDLTVDTYHNFCAEMMIVHNSIEQDSDAVMFLYRDEMYNPETTEFPNQADIILAKHRNGPTGTISLYFEKSITKFMDVNMQHVDLSDLE